MSSIGGLSSSTSSSIRGYGGLASGLDRDSLIEGMTYGTTSKIEKQQQQKKLLQWEQEAVRSISSKMISFADKYINSFSSANNLFSSSFWGRTSITALGANSKYISVSGKASSADPITIAGIKQLAEKAKWSSDAVSAGEMKSKQIDLSQEVETDVLKGQTLQFKLGEKSYSVSLSGKDADGNEYRFDTAENIAKSLNSILADTEISNVSGAKNLADIIKVEANPDGGITFNNEDDYSNVRLTGGTALETLGFQKNAEGNYDEIFIEKDGLNAVFSEDNLVDRTAFRDYIDGKTLTFNYNGVSKEITLKGLTGSEGIDELKANLQTELDKEFGKGRIAVGVDNGSLTFRTTTPGGSDDKSSTLTIQGGDEVALKALGLERGATNKINLNAKISEAGFAGFTGGEVNFKINGVDIAITEDMTVNDLMKEINDKTDVTVSYQAATDKFTFTAKGEGASGSIKFEGADADIAALNGIFGGLPTDEIRGKDAIVSVKYGDSDEAVEIIRDSNSFTIDGLTIGLKGKFGYDEDGNEIAGTEGITFDAKVDSDNVVDTVKKMIEEYNDILDAISKETNTRPDRDYKPLTDAQKKELSEDEIKLYEEKAKQGLLFNDNELKSLSNELRFIISSADIEAMREIGISVSSSYSDNGKLSFDETKFRAALETTPEKVEELFTKEKKTGADGSTATVNGLANNMKTVFDKYVSTLGVTKGVLIERAGSEKAPVSLTKNSLYKQMAEIDKTIASLQDRLEAERDRYVKQFTSLESLIAQMNNQSSWLSQFGGSY